MFIDLERRDGTPYTCLYCGQSCLFAYDAMPRRCVEKIARLKETNDDVYTAYLLKEQVIAFYEQKSKREAEDYLKKWASACIASRLKPFVQLGKRLLRHAKSILEYFVHRVVICKKSTLWTYKPTLTI